MDNNKERVVISIWKEDQKKALDGLRISLDSIDAAKTQTWSDFKKMRNRIGYEPDEMLILLKDVDHEYLRDTGSVDLWKAEKIGWFSPNYHKEKLRLSLNGSIKAKLMEENPDLVFDSFVKFRKVEVEEQSIDIIAGGLGLVQIIHGDGLDDIFARMRIENDIISIKDIKKSDKLFISQLFWFWDNLSESGNATDFDTGTTSELYQTLFDHLKAGPYDKNKFFDILRSSAAKMKHLGDHKLELDDLYDTYIVNGLGIKEPTDLQKTLIQFSKLAKEDIAQLPEILSTNGQELTRTAIYMLGMAVRYQRLSGYIDQGYCLYELVKFIIRYVQMVKVEDGSLIAMLRSEIDDNDRQLIQGVTEFIDKRSDLYSIRKGLEIAEKERNAIEALKTEVNDLRRKNKQMESDIKTEISKREDIISQHLSAIDRLKDVIKDKDDDIKCLRHELERVNVRNNENIEYIGKLESKISIKKDQSAKLSGPKSNSGPKKANGTVNISGSGDKHGEADISPLGEDKTNSKDPSIFDNHGDVEL